jgi:hypothetical protein
MKFNHYFTVLLLFTFTNLLAQTTASIKDKTTNEPIPYVNIWVEGKNIGTTADENGSFNLPALADGAMLVFSAIGYKTLTISALNLPPLLQLSPAAINLQELVIGKKNNRTASTGKFSQSDIYRYFACWQQPWMIAKYFKYEQAYAETPYLKTIRFATRSAIRNSVISMRLYLPDSLGKPGAFLYSQNILCTAKKDTGITEADLSKFKIQMPKEGLVVVFEWLIIEKNKHTFGFAPDSNKPGKKEKKVSYEPAIGMVYDSKAPKIFGYSSGSWADTKITITTIAAELVLSN